jgi:hypothetical protein
LGIEKTTPTMSQQKLNFNEQGLLVPAEVIESDLDTIEKYLVTMFPKSKTRRLLFDNLVEFNQKLQNEVFPWYEQWINGSFVTLKEDPNDVDVVTFFDHEVYDLREHKLDIFMAKNYEQYGLDSYFVKVFPEGHPEFQEYRQYSRYWFEMFTNNKSNGDKGFLKVKFGRNIEK